MFINKPSRKPSNRTLWCGEDGFTILELIMVIIIIGIIAAVAIVPFGSHDERVANAVANMIITDIAYAQELAQIRNTGVVVTFDPGQWFARTPLKIEYQDKVANADNLPIPEFAEGDYNTKLLDLSFREDLKPLSFVLNILVRDAIAGKRNNFEGGDDDDDDGHGKGHGDDDDDDDGHGKGKGHGDDDDDDDGHGKGKGHGDDDDDDDGHGKGEGHGDDDDDDDDGHGKGHGDDDDDDGHGKGKGKGHGDDDDEIDPGGYTLTYSDGTPVSTPEFTNDNFENTSGDLILITSPPRTLMFDGSGILHVPNYTWGADETSMTACSLNDLINIKIARFSGKTWIE